MGSNPILSATFLKWTGQFAASPPGAGPGPDYLLPESDKRHLTTDDLAGLSLTELRIARNEIFARHGRRFSDPELQAWFSARDWYVPRDGEPPLNAIETANVALIAAEEARRN